MSNHLCIVADDGCIYAQPFERETAATVFVNGIIVAGDERLTDHEENLKLLAHSDNGYDLRRHAEDIAAYIRNNNLIPEGLKNTVIITIE